MTAAQEQKYRETLHSVEAVPAALTAMICSISDLDRALSALELLTAKILYCLS
jgi:hypothetical protein